MNPGYKGVRALVERNLEVAVIPIYSNGAAVNSGVHGFNSGRCSSFKKRQHALPVIRRTKAEAEEIVILGLDAFLAGKLANLLRRSLVNIADAGIESAHRTKS